jgi:hypothetical protein
MDYISICLYQNNSDHLVVFYPMQVLNHQKYQMLEKHLSENIIWKTKGKYFSGNNIIPKKIIKYWMRKIKNENPDNKLSIICRLVSDENKYLSPLKLHQKISNLILGKDIKIVKSIMITNTDISFTPKILLKFRISSKKWVSHQEIERIIETPVKKHHLTPFMQDVGYAVLDSLTKYQTMVNRILHVNDIKIYFYE